MKFFILTDLEGPAGVEKFSSTRTQDNQAKATSMKQLAKEVNACIEGIQTVDPEAEVTVWDGHGSGGLVGQEIIGGTFIPSNVRQKPYWQLDGFDAMLFVGQHAMAGAFHAPLCHTYSSTSIAYYKLNGVFVGEFACRALAAGRQNVPVIFLSGDDKAVLEAQAFIPNIVTAAVKKGTGLESAVHLSSTKACQLIQDKAAAAVSRLHECKPFTALEPPFTLEIRFTQPVTPDQLHRHSEAKQIDTYTVIYQTEDLHKLPL